MAFNCLIFWYVVQRGVIGLNFLQAVFKIIVVVCFFNLVRDIRGVWVLGC